MPFFIGDTVHDYEVATAVGADCVLIANTHQSLDILEKMPVGIFGNIIDIIDYVK